MDEPQAVELFKAKLETQNEGQDISELVAALEYMPLAIVQATAYINQRFPRSSVRQYLEDFRRSEPQRIRLLNQDGGQRRRDLEAKNSILITWQISFDHIQQLMPSAADLLSLMSFFDRQGIPEVLLRNLTKEDSGQEDRNSHSGSDSDEDKASELRLAERDQFENDILALRNFSFISVNRDTSNFEMHRLVQLATRKWLEAVGELEKWKQRYIKILYAEFPTGDYKNWPICQMFFPHAQSAAAQRPREPDAQLKWASVVYRAGAYASRRGNRAAAGNLTLKSLKIREKLLGPEHEATLLSMGQVGSVYRDQGRWTKAEELDVQVMEKSKQVLGSEHQDTLIRINNLVLTYWNQGRWKEAGELSMQVIKTSKQVLGAEHPDTLSSMNNPACAWKEQGRIVEAEGLEAQVIETRKQVLGAEHPDTLISINNLTGTWKARGRIAEAEELQVQAIKTYKQVLGAEHPHTLISMSNLACAWKKQGRIAEAEELEVQVAETRKQVLGAGHPDTLISMNNLAYTWKKQGRIAGAIELMVKCVQCRMTLLGIDHPDTQSSSSALIKWKTESSENGK
ncbi:MAG: hypothetical protein Q9157_004203 [Trypethelium eluteriae]